MLHHTSNVGLILSPFFPTFKKWLVAVFRPHLGRHIAEVGPKDIYIYYTSNIIWTKHVVFKYLGLHMHTHIHISTIKEKKEHEFEEDKGYMGGVTGKKEKEKMV